ncbi:MAG: bifunctional oligoribonuclease/PAP phosphatase NrnA [Planctomycetales bacterium]|nr:bifunctional oligoribonuclease/PAP phosphatase NrnA [Planctomycetales bacterium]
MAIDWEPLRSIIAANQRFVLTSHVRPDADALGSELGMAGLLEHLGKDVRIVNASPVPSRLAFLDPDKKVKQLGAEVTEAQALETDVHMILDTSAWGQLAEMGRVFKRTSAVKVVIDHHATAEDLGAIYFKDVESEATGALVFQAAVALGIPITPQIARALYCAIATDTGWFRFPSTTGETMRTIGRLMESGAEPWSLYQSLYEQNSMGRMKLCSRVLSRIKLDCGGRLASTFVRWDDYAETASEPADTEDLVNECLTIVGTVAAFIAIEQSNRNIKVSFRSRTPIDVAQVAQQFGGGGHKQAAGSIMPGPLVDAQTKVLAALTTLLQP